MARERVSPRPPLAITPHACGNRDVPVPPPVELPVWSSSTPELNVSNPTRREYMLPSEPLLAVAAMSPLAGKAAATAPFRPRSSSPSPLTSRVDTLSLERSNPVLAASAIDGDERAFIALRSGGLLTGEPKGE